MDPFPTADVCPTADQRAVLHPADAVRVGAGDGLRGLRRGAHAARGGRRRRVPGRRDRGVHRPVDGTGSVQFEVRSDVENESLGCNAQGRPARSSSSRSTGSAATPPSDPPTTADKACRKGGQFLPGSSNFSNDGVDQAVSPSLWWAESNWRNRFSIPITFGLPPDTCDILDPRPPTGFYGSELLAQAALQWAPAYCLNKKRFKFQHNQMSDDAGWNLMESGGGAGRGRVVRARRGEAPTRSATRRPRSPASRSATSSTCPTTRASSPSCGSTPG